MGKNTICIRFNELLAKRNLTPHAFAVENDLNVSTITGIAAGRNVPKVETLEVIASCLGVALCELICDEEELADYFRSKHEAALYVEQLDEWDRQKVIGYIDRILEEN